MWIDSKVLITCELCAVLKKHDPETIIERTVRKQLKCEQDGLPQITVRPKAHDRNHLGKRKTRIHQPIHDEDHRHYKGKILMLALHNLSNKIILMLR